jgi:hypothetical protein
VSLAEIKSAVDGLSVKELAELAAFIRQRDSSAWDQQIEEDAPAGKLDFLFQEAEKERAAGTLRDWPGARIQKGPPASGVFMHRDGRSTARFVGGMRGGSSTPWGHSTMETRGNSGSGSIS